MKAALEDEVIDILNKALAGKTTDPSSNVRNHASEIHEIIQKVQSGEANDSDWQTLADSLNLGKQALIDVASDPHIEAPSLPEGFHQIILPFGPYTVNAWALTDENSRECVLFDTGTRSDEILDFLKSGKYTPVSLYITHGHQDHVAGLNDLHHHYPEMKIYAFSTGMFNYIEEQADGDETRFAGYTIRTIETPGHAQDAVCYRVFQAGEPSVMIAGDAIFARSVGKIPSDYEQALRIIRERILGEPQETLILPGHGPATSVGEEAAHNPFFSG